MRVSTVDGKSFTLVRETDADQVLIDALHHQHSVHIVDTIRGKPHTEGGGWSLTGVTLIVDRKSQAALRADAGEQTLCALGQLFRLGSREAAQHGHVCANSADPQTQEALAALRVQLQLMSDSLGGEVIQQKVEIKTMVSTHGVPPVVCATVAQGGAA